MHSSLTTLGIAGARALRARAGLLALGLVAVSASAVADDATEIAALRAELARIEARLAALEARSARVPPAPDGGQDASPSADAPEIEAGPGLAVARPDAAARFGIGGRLHLDAYAFDGGARASTGGTEFRRARFHIDGEAAGWGWRLQTELAGRNVDLRDVYLERALGPGTLTIGQFKPHRAMDELTSSNDLSVTERGATSASGLFVERQWQQGIGWLAEAEDGSFGVSMSSLRSSSTARNEGLGLAARATWAPVRDDERLLHLGAWLSRERGGSETAPFVVELAYAGRRGPTARVAEGLGGSAGALDVAGIEFAGRRGSLHWQSEWARARLAAVPDERKLDAGYLQLGWLFGGIRDYDVGEGVFEGPLDVGPGVWELVARYDRIRADLPAAPAVRRAVLGLNWYVSEELRVMLNRSRGEAGEASGGQWALRTQYVF